MFPSHLSTFQAAVQEFVSVPVVHSGYIDHTRDVLKPEWLNLFTLMFHYYFQHMRVNVFQNTPPDPLIDALLLLSDCSDLEALSRAHGFENLLFFLVRWMDEALPSSDSSRDIVQFLPQLHDDWTWEKHVRLSAATQSLMPWSIVSINEGSLSRTFLL